MSREDDDLEVGEEAEGVEHRIRPVAGERSDIKNAIDEAVEAVEAVTRRRGEAGSESDVGQVTGDADVEALQREAEQLRDRLMRTLADFDNYRKRVERERADERKYAVVDPLREVLGIVDNLERALAADGDLEDLKTGVAMILRQMEDFLRRSGVEPVEALDREFDPAVHEAVSRVEDGETDVPRVIDEMQRGYVIHDRLLRPAIVRVAVPAPTDDVDEAAESEFPDEVDAHEDAD
jgi:molecular chaperone GrpE